MRWIRQEIMRVDFSVGPEMQVQTFLHLSYVNIIVPCKTLAAAMPNSVKRAVTLLVRVMYLSHQRRLVA